MCCKLNFCDDKVNLLFLLYSRKAFSKKKKLDIKNVNALD